MTPSHLPMTNQKAAPVLPIRFNEMTVGKRYRITNRFGLLSFPVEGIYLRQDAKYIHLETVGRKVIIVKGRLDHLHSTANALKITSCFKVNVLNIEEL